MIHPPPQISHLQLTVTEANFCSSQLRLAYGLDVLDILDLHFHFCFSLRHRMADGVPLGRPGPPLGHCSPAAPRGRCLGREDEPSSSMPLLQNLAGKCFVLSVLQQ
ncbi:hypothetical protein NHX12_014429 [Muraenolepis orangiensis]|uniref:Uncharacterized protein n=1 Tax=Muraenolepis orangiensis TaxID=630683 RepID=A0A9Q0DEU4_9TELE|nr:hypothetical protein NHX12_014429 [Muraenolepis orangiensis]